MNTFSHIISKYKIEVGKQYIVEIPNMGRNNLAELFAELGFEKGAEIGVEGGLYSEVLLKANPELHLYSIDPWSEGAYDPDSYGVVREQKEYNALFEETTKRLVPYNCTIIRKTSADALSDFKDGSLDFVYIDANHDFPNFIFDIHNWLKKVKIGGIMSGHDYTVFSYRKFNHVKRALDAYARCYRMIPLFIVGAFEYNTGIRDKYRSFLWVKDK